MTKTNIFTYSVLNALRSSINIAMNQTSLLALVTMYLIKFYCRVYVKQAVKLHVCTCKMYSKKVVLMSPDLL